MDKNDDVKSGAGDQGPANEVSRRKFVSTVATAAGILIVPRHVLGGVGYQAPSDRVNIATIGYRHGMGTSNTNALLKVPNVSTSEVALSARRSKALTRAASSGYSNGLTR